MLVPIHVKVKEIYKAIYTFNWIIILIQDNQGIILCYVHIKQKFCDFAIVFKMVEHCYSA